MHVQYRFKKKFLQTVNYRSKVNRSDDIVEFIGVVIVTEDQERLINVICTTQRPDKVTKIFGTIVNLNDYHNRRLTRFQIKAIQVVYRLAPVNLPYQVSNCSHITETGYVGQ